MKLKLDVWHHLLDVYAKFEINIFKNVQKSMENFKKSQTCKNDCQNSGNKIFPTIWTFVEHHTEGYLCTKFERFIFIYEAMIAKN